MGLLELLLIALGLSMDAFAVSLCKGLEMKKLNYRHAGVIALFFGGFQAAMPLFGWGLAKQFERYIKSFDHWIAFGLLIYIGAKMIYNVFTGGECPINKGDKLNLNELLLLAVATSIDALAAGITFALLETSIAPAVLIIGVFTFTLSFAGVIIGKRFGALFKSKAELAGGIVLIIIGVKIVAEHLGLLR